jgi:hypothetical protein
MIPPVEQKSNEKSSSGSPLDTKVDTASTTKADSALARIVAAWPNLPLPIRRAMLSLID